MSAKVLAVANQKGGVGKTTTTLTLSAALARMGKQVLVMDLDPHACASVHLRCYADTVAHTVYDIFSSPREDQADLWERLAIGGEERHFDLAPASIRLSELENDLKDRRGKGAILLDSLALIRDRYDYIVLDCPPHVGILLVNALVASDLIVIPIQTDFLALHGVKLLFDTMRTLNRALPQKLSYKALATMYDVRAGACRRVLNLLRRKFQGRMFETIIRLDTKFREASGSGKVIFDLDPESRGAREYAHLATEIEGLW